MKTMKTTNRAPVVVLPQPPRQGPLWLWFKFFPLLYRLHLGWLLGHHSLRLSHQGRKTGRMRHTALDVMRFDPATKECLVVSMYGERSDWFRNIMAHPALLVQTGRDRFVPEQRILPPQEAQAVMTTFWQRYPRAVRTSLQLLGFQYEDTQESQQVILSALRVVSFRPKASSQAGNDMLRSAEVEPKRDDRKGKRSFLSRRAWAVVSLLSAGWFLHDAVWHLMLAAFGMNTLLGMEFSLPDLGAYHIYPDRAIQTFAFFFALGVASLLLWLGLRLRQRS